MITFDYVPKEELLKPKDKQNNDIQPQERKKPTEAYFSKGEALFKILAIEDGFSKAGKPKTMFHLEIEDMLGKKGKRTEHVSKKASLTFMKISEAVGGGIYQEGGFYADTIVGKSGVLQFGIKETEEWGVQNEVVDWIPYKGPSQENQFKSGLPAKQETEADNFDDDIPF